MALKGLDIFKLTPKKNCKECGSPTCMAFAMKVAQGSVSIDKCPYMSADALATLSEATAPLMKTIEVGAGANAHKLGGETVLFRHEKTLVSKNLYAVSLCSCMSDADVDAAIADMKKVDYERIGEREYVEFLFLNYADNGVDKYVALVKKAMEADRALILNCKDAGTAKAALEVCKAAKPILNGATKENAAEMSAVATAAGVTLGVSAQSIEELYDTVKALEAAGNKNLVLDVTGKDAKETLKNAVLVRRTSLKDQDRTFGYPSIVNLDKIAHGDLHMQTALAAMFTVRYGSIIVMSKMTYAEALALYGLRQNIYTDPQKPMKVEQGIYPLNGADENSPCALTVDFALTYFLVSGELERSKQPVNLIITDASGMSVLTAWAAGKLSSNSIEEDLHRAGHREQDQEPHPHHPRQGCRDEGRHPDKLPGWNVVVAPQEAVQLPKYMKDKEYEEAAKAAAAANAAKAETAAAAAAVPELTFDEILATKVPKIEVVDMGVHYKGHNPEAQTFVTIGERIHCISPSIRKAMDERNPAPILKRAAEQIAAGATYLDVNIGPAESDGPERMMWAVKLLQENFDNVPLALDTANKKAIEAGIKVYNRTERQADRQLCGRRLPYLLHRSGRGQRRHRYRPVLCRRYCQGQRGAHEALPQHARARP